MIIINGERRWRAIQELHKLQPEEERFRTIRAFESPADMPGQGSLRVVQLLVNSTAADLTPTEKALVIKEIQCDKEGKKLSDAALQAQFGISKGQFRLARALAFAPDFIQAFGLPRTYKVTAANGGDSKDDSDLKKVTIEAAPLGMSLLAELVTLYNKLQAYDAKAFRESGGRHKPVAEIEITRIGTCAQRDGWSKAQLQSKCEAAYKRYTIPRQDKNASAKGRLNSIVEKLHVEVQKALATEAHVEHVQEIAQALRTLLARIESAPLN